MENGPWYWSLAEIALLESNWRMIWRRIGSDLDPNRMDRWPCMFFWVENHSIFREAFAKIPAETSVVCSGLQEPSVGRGGSGMIGLEWEATLDELEAASTPDEEAEGSRRVEALVLVLARYVHQFNLIDYFVGKQHIDGMNGKDKEGSFWGWGRLSNLSFYSFKWPVSLNQWRAS